MNLKKALFLDLEMCCWNDGRKPNTGEIIEIGLTEVDIASLQITRTAQYYVKPDSDEVSEFCTELTGITQSRINKQGRPLTEALATWKKKFGLDNKTVFAWGHDDNTLIRECDFKGIDFKFGQYINLADTFRLLHGVERISQVKAMEMYGLSFEGRQHGAQVDSHNLARLYIEMSKRARG